MEIESKVVPFSNHKIKDIDLNKTIKDAQVIMNDLQKQRIKEATYTDGTYFKEDTIKKTTVLATDGIAIQQNKHTTVIIWLNEKSECLKT